MGATVLAQWQARHGDPDRIVSFDVERPDRLTDVAVPVAGTTNEFPFTDGHRVGWVNLPVGGNVNLTPERGVVTVDYQDGQGPTQVRLPAGTWDVDALLKKCRWGAFGHPTFTPAGTILGAARRDGTWWIFPASTWGLLEVDRTGQPVQPGKRPDSSWVEGRFEPCYTGLSLAVTSSAGVHAGGRIFKPMVRNPFDPVVSPNGRLVVWLEQQQVSLFGLPLGRPLCALIVGDLATGERRTVVPATDGWLTCNAHWIDDATLVAAQTNSPTGPWVLVTVDVPTGTVVPRTRAEHGSFLAPVAA